MSIDSIDEKQELTLKTLRESAGYTQEKLAKELNLAKSTIGYYEAGKKIPGFDKAIALARELGVSLKTLAKAMHLDVSGIPDDVGQRGDGNQ